MTVALILVGLAFLAFILVSLIANIRHKQAKKLDRMYRKQAGIEMNDSGLGSSSCGDIGGGFDGGGD